MMQTKEPGIRLSKAANTKLNLLYPATSKKLVENLAQKGVSTIKHL